MEIENKKRVLLGMSGGIDSSVSAILLLKEGYEVVGATMNLVGDNTTFIQEINDAKAVAKKLKIKHIVLNFSKEFKKDVIDYFSSEYTKGLTPNPCIVCNKKIKFGLFLDYALSNGFDFIATGHYANIEYDSKIQKYKLKKSTTNKDQSYFLYTLTQKIMAHTLFPIGNLEKDIVREIAKKNNLPIAYKFESQDICFIKNSNYVEFIKNILKIDSSEGNFLDEKNNIIGKHKGLINYTVGQRKKLGVAFGVHMYVSNINPINNTITLSKNEPLKVKGLTASDINLIMHEKPIKSFKTTSKMRYSTTKPVPCTVTYSGENTAKVEFESAQNLVSPGQFIVFYDGDCVLGGGKISSIYR